MNTFLCRGVNITKIFLTCIILYHTKECFLLNVPSVNKRNHTTMNLNGIRNNKKCMHLIKKSSYISAERYTRSYK